MPSPSSRDHRIVTDLFKEFAKEQGPEHGTAKYLIRQLLAMNQDNAHFCAKVKVLREYVKHHMDEEEKELFPKVKQAGPICRRWSSS
jgi:hemerythrin-like domain-containing protein